MWHCDACKQQFDDISFWELYNEEIGYEKDKRWCPLCGSDSVRFEERQDTRVRCPECMKVCRCVDKCPVCGCAVG